MRITSSFLKFNQGKRDLLLTKLSAEVLVAITYAAVRGKDEETGAVQRILNTERIAKIRDFTIRGGAYPNAFIINWVSTTNTLLKESSIVSFEIGERLAQIIDGQHRIAGIKEAIKVNTQLKDLELPVVIYENLTTKECAEIFLSINTEQKPVPRSLVYDLYGLLGEDLSDPAISRARDIAVFLNESESSPYYTEIKFPGSKKRKGGIALSTAVSSIKPLVEPKSIFDQIGISELEIQKRVFLNYFIAIQKQYDSFWENKENVFRYSSGFSGAIEFLKSKLLSYCNFKRSFTIETIQSALRITDDTVIKQAEVKKLGGSEQANRVYERLVESFFPEGEEKKIIEY